MVRAVLYRVTQFLRALTAQVSQEEVGEATRILPPAAQMLFRRQAIQDQRHALAVYGMLAQADHANVQLLAAALLHDVGKDATGLASWQRAMIVLLSRFTPRLLIRLGAGGLRHSCRNGFSECSRRERSDTLPRGWRRPFVIHVQHPELGARRALEAGCSALTATLIRRHQDELVSCHSEEDKLLAALQVADSLN